MFEYTPTNSFNLTYNYSSSIRDLLSTNETRAISNDVFLGLAENSFVVQQMEKLIIQLTQIPIVSMFVSKEKINELDKKLAQIK